MLQDKGSMKAVPIVFPTTDIVENTPKIITESTAYCRQYGMEATPHKTVRKQCGRVLVANRSLIPNLLF
jgi:hypothetical protein